MANLDTPAAPLRAGLGTLLTPASAVLVGASDRTVLAASSVRNLARGGARVWGVHPTRSDVLGLECHPSIGDLPAVPELAYIMVGPSRVEAAFDEALAAGVGAFVIPGLSSEAGDQAQEIAARIAEKAAAAQAVLLGPNCMGVAVPDRVSFWHYPIPATFRSGSVAAVVQSGSIGMSLVSLGPRVGFRCVVSTGAEAVCDVADFSSYFAQDDETTAVALFVEAVRRPEAFVAALEQLAEAGKPVVCLKTGRSEAASRAALAHTGALVGSAETFSAVLRRYGAIEARDYPEFVETLEVLGQRRRPAGTRVGVITDSGGEGALVADQASDAGIPLPSFSPELAAGLTNAFPLFIDPFNPLDAWAVGDTDEVFPRSLEILAQSGEFDVLAVLRDQTQFAAQEDVDFSLMLVDAVADAADGTDAVPAIISMQVNDPAPAVATRAQERGVALLRGPRDAMRALANAGGLAPYEPVAATPLSGTPLPAGALPEHESAALLERYGVPFARRQRADGPEAAAAAAAELGWPVVVKRDGPAHKSASGGVVLGLRDTEAVAEATRRLGGSVLVAEQAPDGIEVLCGVVRDPDFGPVVTVGLGGRVAEAMPAFSAMLAPLTPSLARAMVSEVLPLRGTEFGPAREALEGVLVALSEVCMAHPEIDAVDVNPVIVQPESAIAVDALVVVADTNEANTGGSNV